MNFPIMNIGSQPTVVTHGPLTTAAPTKVWTPPVTGYYHLVFGTGASDSFGGGTVSVTQCARTLPNLSALATSGEGHHLVHLIGGKTVTLTLAGSTAGVVTIISSLDPEWPRTH